MIWVTVLFNGCPGAVFLLYLFVGFGVIVVEPGKKKVKNKDLWKELDRLSKKYQIKWLWVKGHSGDITNEEVEIGRAHV